MTTSENEVSGRRELGRTGWKVSPISFGAWAIGGSWGTVDDTNSLEALQRSIDLGVNFIDTADVYGDGRSERLVAELRRQRKETIYVATKAGRRLEPHTADGYNRKNLTAFVERSLKNLNVETIDLLQLHCPSPEVYYRPEVFGILDDLVKDGKLRYYGVSVEKVEEALMAIEYPNVQTIQIIFNVFRQRPAELFFEQAKKRKVGIIARVPLASGLLTGKLKKNTQFESEDHRAFNRHGESFDRGETFSGVDYETGTAGGGGAARTDPARDDDEPVRIALDPDVRRGIMRDTRGKECEAGGGEHSGGRVPAALKRGDVGGRAVV